MNVMLTEGGDILKLADFGLAIDMNGISALIVVYSISICICVFKLYFCVLFSLFFHGNSCEQRTKLRRSGYPILHCPGNDSARKLFVSNGLLVVWYYFVSIVDLRASI
jgi:hypothetical protein